VNERATLRLGPVLHVKVVVSKMRVVLTASGTIGPVCTPERAFAALLSPKNGVPPPKMMMLLPTTALPSPEIAEGTAVRVVQVLPAMS
jgi:hypothetical protein